MKMSGAATSGVAAVGATAYLAIVANAIKACGTIVRVEPEEFLKILALQTNPLVIESSGGFFVTTYRYLTSYRGLAFHCKCRSELWLPSGVELIKAKKMSVPDL